MWWGPRGFSSPSVEVDLRVGSRCRIAMQPPEGTEFHLSGVFQEVEPAVRLGYTFWWEEPDVDDRLTVVALTLRDLSTSTELVLQQGAFATKARLALHHQGWNESLDKLGVLLAATSEQDRQT